MGATLVSIITPAYNCAATVVEMVRSVQAQDMQSWELVFCDDASTDGTWETLCALAQQDNRVRLLRNAKNAGPAAARNRALGEAKGDFIAFLDADDSWLPGKLSQQLTLLAETGAQLCYTGYRFVNKDGSPAGIEYRVPVSITYKKCLVQNVFNCNTVLLRRDALDGLRFNPAYAHEDFVFWLALLKKGVHAVGIPQPLAVSRLGGRNKNKWHAAKNRWVVYRQSEGLGRIAAAVYWCRYVFTVLRKYGVKEPPYRFGPIT